MRWFGGRESDNVEDDRGGGGGITGGHIVGGGIGTLVIAFIVYLLGGNPSQVLQQPDQQSGQYSSNSSSDGQPTGGPHDSTYHFVRTVLAETEDVWDSLFRSMGKSYVKPKLVLFTGEVQSGCGGASSETGPFYCPADQKVYLDMSFFSELKNRFNAPGDFANAYVIAHEVGHHVQQQLGTTDKIDQMRQNADKKEANRLSVMVELQADFYAGVWAHYAQKMEHVIEAGDIEAALNAASQIGDDRLQQETQGRVVPDAFTHGTSQQRMFWFKKGYETGDISQGNTFKELGGM